MKKDKKTIGITIRFFTNGLPGRVGTKREQIPFWTRGNVHLEANRAKGIKPQNEIFNYFEDVSRVIKVVLSRSKLVAVEDVAYSMRAGKRRKKKL